MKVEYLFLYGAFVCASQITFDDSLQDLLISSDLHYFAFIVDSKIFEKLQETSFSSVKEVIAVVDQEIDQYNHRASRPFEQRSLLLKRLFLNDSVTLDFLQKNGEIEQ